VSHEWGARRVRGGRRPRERLSRRVRGGRLSRRAALAAGGAAGGRRGRQLSRLAAPRGADADPVEKPASSTFSSGTAVRGLARRGKTGKGRFPLGRPLFLSHLHQPWVACPHAAHRASGGAAPAAAAWSLRRTRKAVRVVAALGIGPVRAYAVGGTADGTSNGTVGSPVNGFGRFRPCACRRARARRANVNLAAAVSSRL